MLPLLVGLAFLVVPCASQTGSMAPVIGISPPPKCRQDFSTSRHSTLAFLIVPCATQTGNIGVVTGISPPKRCLSPNFAPEQWLVRMGLYLSVNHLRRQLAIGKDVFPTVLYRKGPRLMYAMRYSCDLEKKAFFALQSGKRPEGYNWLQYKSKPEEKGKRNLTSYLVEAATQWKQSDSPGPSTLMYPFVLFMGCAYDNKVEGRFLRFRLMCLFDRKDIGVWNPMYPTCKVDKDCKWFRDSTCQKSLCWGPQEPYNIQ